MKRLVLTAILVQGIALSLLSQCYTKVYDKDDVAALQDIDALAASRRWTGIQYEKWQGVTWGQYTSGPTCIYRVTGLTIDWKLNGDLPPSIAKLTQLQTLKFTQTGVSGVLPEDIGNLVNLKTLWISDAKLHGPLPASMANLTNVEEILLFSNQLSGDLPDIFGLPKIRRLMLRDNAFAIPFPSDVGNAKTLEQLDLSYNQFTGRLPEAMRGLESLTHLSVYRNKLEGKAPDALAMLRNLKSVVLAENLFAGIVPDFISVNPNLEWIDLHSNSFTLINLDRIGQLSGLRFLDLSSNGIKGRFPMDILRLKEQLDISVADNHFSFADLAPFANNAYPAHHLNLGRQREMGVETNVDVRIGDVLTLDGGDGFAGNVYQWRFRPSKDDFATSEPITKILIDNAEKAFRYYGDITGYFTNPGFGFAIETKPIHVRVKGIFTLAPNETVISKKGSFDKDPDKIVKLSLVKGTVTDGVSELILLATSDGRPITFRLAGDDPGTLRTIGGNEKDLREITVESMFSYDPRGYKAICIYTPPDGYGIYASRGRDVSVLAFPADYTSEPELSDIRLMTPPVVMVHGLWSDPTTWQTGGFQRFLRDRGFVVRDQQLADYSWASSQTFDPYKYESRTGRNAVSLAIQSALRYFNDSLKIAAVQADVVAHSLGGLMSRSFTGQNGYASEVNYFKGSIHRLITIGTPHGGSPYGPFLYGLKLVNHPVKVFGNELKYQIGSVHRDFSPTSDAYMTLRYYNHKDTKIHAVTTSYVPDISHPATLFERLFHGVTAKPYTVLFDGEENDGIVALTSQRGGIRSGATSFYRQIRHDEQTASPVIQQRVSDLLYTKNTNLFSTLGQMGAEENRNGRTQSDHVVDVPKAQFNDPIVSIVKPNTGAVVLPGATTSLEYSLAGDQTLRTAMFISGFQDLVEVPTDVRRADWKASDAIHFGETQLTLLAITQNDRIVSDQVTIKRPMPETPLFDFEVFPLSISIDAYNTEMSIRVNAITIANGLETYVDNLSDPASGIKFKTIHGKAAVNDRGVVSGIAEGVDTVILTLGSFMTRIPVSISKAACPDVIVIGAIAGDRNPCPGIPSEYSINESRRFDAVWSVEGSGILPPAGNQININWTKPGTYTLTVEAVNACGQAIQSDLVIEVPDAVFVNKPEISMLDGSLVSSYSFGNQWFFNGVAIPGATDRILRPESTGTYTVRVTTSCGESPFSEVYRYTVTGIEHTSTSRFNIYPNPAQAGGQIILDTTEPVSDFLVVDVLGNIRQVIDHVRAREQITIAELAAGTYFISAKSGSGQVTRRLIILK